MSIMRTVRQVHLYLGVLFAPSLLFFAATGALQLFGLHEARPGSAYQPPAIVEKLAEVHKNQRFASRSARAPAAHGGDHAAATQARRKPPRPTALQTWALKLFFLASALGLMVSTGLGLWIGLQPGRGRRLAWGLLAAGLLIPIVLLAI